MTLAEMVVAEARRYLQVRETPPGSNRGTAIDYWIMECGLDPKGGYPWCAAFVGQVGRQALGRQWPCPRTASVAALFAWAEATRLVELSPGVGDLFVVWHPELRRFGHVGFVAAVNGSGKIASLEGNTSGGGSREGWGVFERQRVLKPEDRCLRWTRALHG